MKTEGIIEMSPGIRSLLIHFDGLRLPMAKLVEILKFIEKNLSGSVPDRVKSRIVNLPIACRDSSVKESLEKYKKLFRAEAPYLPCNVEFAARCNGLANGDEVVKYLTESQYLVLGLGDVYLGAPCAVALDPRKRMVVPKMNPARSWTAEGVVGLGGSTLCIYPMASPGGYQLMGRTLQIWNTWQTNNAFKDAPWLLRQFDKIQWQLVEERELIELRGAVTNNTYEFKITEDVFDIKEYNKFLEETKDETVRFEKQKKESIKSAMIGY
jgi:urea carboxylase